MKLVDNINANVDVDSEDGIRSGHTCTVTLLGGVTSSLGMIARG
jgi:hypothetical protein